jgi:hypothetical protein
MFKPENLYQHLDMRKSDAFPTPRAWALLSKFTKDKIASTDIDTLELMAQTRIGDGIGGEFAAFIKLREKIDCEKTLNNPENVHTLELDLRLAFASWMVENVGRKGYLEKVLRAVPHMGKDDLSLLIMTMIKGKIGKAALRAQLEKKEFEFLFEYHKYLKDD